MGRRLATIVAFLLPLTFLPTVARAATGVGFQAHSYAGFNAETSGGAITGQKPESKLWYLDGFWWAVMLSPTQNGAHTIWRLDPSGWTNTGTIVDTRPATREDVLWTGSKLYVSSRSGGANNLLRRFSYSSGVYTLEAGPITLPVSSPETLTIARDTTGTMWITFEQSTNIYVAHSIGNDSTWGSPFVIPVPQASGVDPDDISAVVAFTDATGPAIGVQWSNTTASSQYFAVHRDGAADNAWSVETALSGFTSTDDHINIKTFEQRMYSVVKTAARRSTDALIKTLVRSPTGTWSAHAVATVAENNTRPIAVLDIDPSSRRIYVFMTKGEGTSAEGIYYKASSVDSIGFPATATPFIHGANNEPINDATSTKQNTDSTTGIVVLASDGTNYWWNKIGGGQSTAPPSAVAGSASTNEDTTVSVTLSGTDPDTCELSFTVATPPAHGTLGGLTGQVCTAGSPNADDASVTYTPANNYAGSDSFTFTVGDGTNTSAPATVAITVNPVDDSPTATGTSTTTGKDTPVVATLKGSDAETCELTFAITTGPAHGSLGPIGSAACAPGNPNSDTAPVTFTPDPGYLGGDSFAFTVSDGVLTSAPATVTITVSTSTSGIQLVSSSSGSNATATTLTIAGPPAAGPGDVMVAMVSVKGDPSIIAPSGWTLVRTDSVPDQKLRQVVYVRVWSSEPANYTWTFDSPQAAAGGILAYSGVDTSAPVDVHSGAVHNARGTTNYAPSVTTTVPGDMLIGFFGIGAQTTITPPTGMTERFDIAATGGAFLVTAEGCDVIRPTAGATGVKTASTPGVTAYSIGQLVALRPAAP